MKTYSYEILSKNEYSDFDNAKKMYKSVVKVYKETNDKEFLLNELKILFEVQGSENFKKITGFDYNTLQEESYINTMDDLLKIIQAKILIFGKNDVVKKTGLSIPTINRFFSETKDVSLKTLFNITDSLNIKLKIMV